MADKTYKLTFALSDGTTINAGTFVAPQGEQGIQGAQGIQGKQGVQGVKGDTGEKGDPGENGITPTIGANGNWFLGNTDTNKPSRGVKGDKGDKGDTGPKGATGPQGATGPRGVSVTGATVTEVV